MPRRCSLVTSETRAVVHGLHPLTAYSVMLVARWSRFGQLTGEGRDQLHVLQAAFVTTGLGGSKLTAEQGPWSCDLNTLVARGCRCDCPRSSWMATDLLGGATGWWEAWKLRPATARIPVEGQDSRHLAQSRTGGQPAAVTLDLDPCGSQISSLFPSF